MTVLKAKIGADWVPVGGMPLNAAALSQVIGLTGENHATTPNTQYNLRADAVLLVDPATGAAYAVRNVTTLTNNLLVAPPTANGRDQAGAFSANSWIHFYFVRTSAGVIQTRSSLTAPPTGPTLAAGEVAWAYAGAVRYNATPALATVQMRGSWIFYETLVPVLAGGTATTATAVSLATAIPPNALRWQGTMWNTGVTADAAGSTDALHLLRYVLLGAFIEVKSRATGLTPSTAAYGQTLGFTMPNQGQQFYYFHSLAAGSGPSMSVDLQGYAVPNGGE